MQMLSSLFQSSISAVKRSSTSSSTSLAFVVVCNEWQKRKSFLIVWLWIYQTNTINSDMFAELTDSSSCIPNTDEALIFLIS